jgi:hypothetical protein
VASRICPGQVHINGLGRVVGQTLYVEDDEVVVEDGGGSRIEIGRSEIGRNEIGLMTTGLLEGGIRFILASKCAAVGTGASTVVASSAFAVLFAIAPVKV